MNLLRHGVKNSVVKSDSTSKWTTNMQTKIWYGFEPQPHLPLIKNGPHKSNPVQWNDREEEIHSKSESPTI